jgi:hypothetical protein
LSSSFDWGADAGGDSARAATSLSSGSGTGRPTACVSDSDCDTHDPCLTYSCDVTSSEELSSGQCVYTSIDGGAACAAWTADNPPTTTTTGGKSASSVGLPPIDLACESTQKLASVFPPYTPLAPPDVPASCAGGFQTGDVDESSGVVYELPATPAGGAAAITLDIDFATYLEPDGVLITGVDASGETYTLLDTCRMQTWTAGDPTDGLVRPPDDTIRQFRVDVVAGTRSLKIDFSRVVSPMYIQVLGLCDFDVTRLTQAKWWAAVN